jgi:DHA2 family multidrug resistance protein-like MFS transporter
VIVGGLLVTAVGVACLLGVDSAGSTMWVIVGLCTIGLGMGSVTTPATSMLVSHLPAEKAGVGSAMNDVTREFGTAFGVAVLGTIVAFRYSGRLADVTAALPAAQRTAARNNVSHAMDVARDIGGDGGARLAAATRSAFTSGLTLAVAVSVVLLVVLAAVAVALLPHARRARRHHWWASPVARAPAPTGAAVATEVQTAPVPDGAA